MDKDIIAQEINAEYLKGYIYSIKGVRVMLDMDLAKIYGYSTKDFNRQVKNNIEKFEQDFMFQLSDEECEILRCKNSTFRSLSSKPGRFPPIVHGTPPRV